MVKKKLITCNKRVESILFNTVKPYRIDEMNIPKEDIAFIALF